MELDRSVQRHIPALSQDAERLEDADGARAIVVSAGGRQQGEEVVCRVLVGTNDRQRRRGVADLWLEAGDDARLREAVGEVLERNMRMEGRFSNDLLSLGRIFMAD